MQSGTHDRCISQSSICIVTSCKTMLIYPCTKICMYCCYDPTTQLNKLGPIKAWIPENKFRNCSSETGKARNSPGPLSWPIENCLPPRHFRNLCALQRPQPRLLQLALPLQEHGQVVHPNEGVGVFGSQLGLAAFQGSAVETFCLARDGALIRR